MKKERIGSFWTDTGTILLGDPCQFVHDPSEKPHLTYSELGEMFRTQGIPYTEPAIVIRGKEIVPACERTERAQRITIPSRGGGTAGLAVTVGVDGWYPVYVVRGKEGEPLRIIIECGGKTSKENG